MTADSQAPASAGGTAAPLAVLRGVLRSRRRPLVLWSIALTAVTTIYTSFYPAMGDGADLEVFTANLPEGMVAAFGFDTIATPGGYLGSTVFGLLGPALLLVFAIGWGSRAVAGAEEDGTLELELAHPVARSQIYLDRLASLWVSVALLGLVVFAVTLGWTLALDMDVPAGNLLAGAVGLVGLAVAIGSVAFAIGAWTGRRGLAAGGAAGIAVLAYVADALGPTVDGLGWLSRVSPWSWYAGNDPLLEGFDLAGLALLAALALVASLLGWLRYRRRDLGV